jgi:sugar phosphate isomerase/epimerase
MQRRTFVAAALAAASTRAAGNRIDRSRLSVISDEVAASPEDAIAFAKQYKIDWLALRTVPGTKVGYWSMEPADLAAAARQIKDAGLRVSFLDTSLLKFGLPGTEPVRKTPEEPAAREKRIAREQAQFDRRLDDLGKAIRAGRAFGTNMVRIFTFSRIAKPDSLYPRICEMLNDMAIVAEHEGVKLVIENEGSQNCGTCAETAALVAGIASPAIGINWDTTNGVPLGEKAFPDGYDALPKDRIYNVHMKGKSLLDYPERLDWTAVVRRLEKDGYAGKLELETHVANDQRIAASHASIKEIIKVLEPS